MWRALAVEFHFGLLLATVLRLAALPALCAVFIERLGVKALSPGAS